MALIPIFQNERSPTPKSLVKTLYLSFGKITRILAPQTPLKPLIQGLYNLPPELQELVFSFMLDSPGGSTIFNEEALDVLKALQLWPEKRHRRISCNVTLFARWNKIGSMSYLAGIYEKNFRDSIQIKSDEDWNCLVISWNELRITNMALVRSDSALATTGGPGSIQILRRPTYETLWITMQVSAKFL
jgi:hypothetical protein